MESTTREGDVKRHRLLEPIPSDDSSMEDERQVWFQLMDEAGEPQMPLECVVVQRNTNVCELRNTAYDKLYNPRGVLCGRARGELLVYATRVDYKNRWMQPCRELEMWGQIHDVGSHRDDPVILVVPHRGPDFDHYNAVTKLVFDHLEPLYVSSQEFNILETTVERIGELVATPSLHRLWDGFGGFPMEYFVRVEQAICWRDLQTRLRECASNNPMVRLALLGSPGAGRKCLAMLIAIHFACVEHRPVLVFGRARQEDGDSPEGMNWVVFLDGDGHVARRSALSDDAMKHFTRNDPRVRAAVTLAVGFTFEMLPSVVRSAWNLVDLFILEISWKPYVAKPRRYPGITGSGHALAKMGSLSTTRALFEVYYTTKLLGLWILHGSTFKLFIHGIFRETIVHGQQPVVVQLVGQQQPRRGFLLTSVSICPTRIRQASEDRATQLQQLQELAEDVYWYHFGPPGTFLVDAVVTCQALGSEGVAPKTVVALIKTTTSPTMKPIKPGRWQQVNAALDRNARLAALPRVELLVTADKRTAERGVLVAADRRSPPASTAVWLVDPLALLLIHGKPTPVGEGYTRRSNLHDFLEDYPSESALLRTLKHNGM